MNDGGHPVPIASARRLVECVNTGQSVIGVGTPVRIKGKIGRLMCIDDCVDHGNGTTKGPDTPFDAFAKARQEAAEANGHKAPLGG